MRESENKTKAIINLEKARDMLYNMDWRLEYYVPRKNNDVRGCEKMKIIVENEIEEQALWCKSVDVSELGDIFEEFGFSKFVKVEVGYKKE